MKYIQNRTPDFPSYTCSISAMATQSFYLLSNLIVLVCFFSYPIFSLPRSQIYPHSKTSTILTLISTCNAVTLVQAAILSSPNSFNSSLIGFPVLTAVLPTVYCFIRLNTCTWFILPIPHLARFHLPLLNPVFHSAPGHWPFHHSSEIPRMLILRACALAPSLPGIFFKR